MTARRGMAFLITATVLAPALAISETPQPAPFAFDNMPGKLPKDVVPTLYHVQLTPNAAAGTLSGSENIELEVRRPTGRIQLNSLNEVLKNVRLDGKLVKNVESDDKQQVTTITLAGTAAPGKHTLQFEYSGQIEKQPHGLFAQPYVLEGNKTGMLLSTQMEATDARRMFPCWDEPAFRSQFQLTVIVPSTWTAISNMPITSRTVQDSLATVAFQTSPRMPSYLVELSAGDLAQIDGGGSPTRLAVWAVRGQEQNGRIALENAKQILSDYNDYFGVDFPLPKLDSIAIPGGFSGAMENWGAITYNDRTLLVTPNSTLSDRQRVYSIQAHEMAHQWSGDLVTMGWWDDIWLNESFASWRAAKETDMRNPQWKWWQREDTAREAAMAADARLTTHAIQQHVADELQVDNSFDPEITYSKGQAVLRMLEAFMGPDTFRDGIRQYMKAHAYSNATTADLWASLTAVGKDNIAAIAADWTSQPGFPLVKVNASCTADGTRTLQFSQQRFLLRGSDDHHPLWRVPLQIRAGNAPTPQSVLLSQDTKAVNAGHCGEPLSVNADAVGYFRVQYDAQTLAVNRGKFDAIPDGDRIALLDDQWALVESDQGKLVDYLGLAAAMQTNLNTRSWEQIAGALEIVEHDERGARGHDAFVAYARNLVRPVVARLGWNSRPEESPDIQKLRRTLIGELGAWDDAGVIREARTRYQAFLKDHASLRPDDQVVVLRIVMRNADAATFDQVDELAKAARDQADIERYYLALSAVKDPALARKVADIALSQGELPPQSFLPLNMVYGLSDQHKQFAWTTFTGHVDQLLGRFPSFAPIYIAQYAPARFWDAVTPEMLETWVKAHVPPEMAQNVARGMETVHFRVSEKQSLLKAVDSFLQSQGGRQKT